MRSFMLLIVISLQCCYEEKLLVPTLQHTILLHFVLNNDDSVVVEHILHKPQFQLHAIDIEALMEAKRGMADIVVDENGIRLKEAVIRREYIKKACYVALSHPKASYITTKEFFLRCGLPTALFDSIEKFNIADYLHPYEIDLYGSSYKLRHQACIVSKLKEDRTIATEQKYDLLFYAACGGLKNIILTLIDQGIDLNRCRFSKEEQNTVLMIAIKAGHKEIVETLLEHGADPNIINKYGQTALAYAVEYRDCSKYLELLLDYKADQCIADVDGNIPLTIAAGKGSKECVQCLLRNNKQLINYQNKAGCTALHRAIANYRIDIIACLLANNANPNIVAEQGTPLHIAVFLQWDRIVDMLLQHHADPMMKNLQGESVFAYAKKHRYFDSLLSLQNKL